jgi:PPOX class probable F420-dependent enzyme
MPSQGDLGLLDSPIAQKMLNSTDMAQLAYVWTDGTPRVVPIWFHWNGREIVVASPPAAPKVKALRQQPEVAVTINSTQWPYNVLLIRGRASVEVVEGIPPEYTAAARRYMGEEQGQAWLNQFSQIMPQTARIAVRPEWVGTLDFETRFPSAVESAMARAS